jgi:hypothetical protein
VLFRGAIKAATMYVTSPLSRFQVRKLIDVCKLAEF